MGVNKVIYGTQTVMDISDSTVTSETLAEGAVAYGADGERIVGAMSTTIEDNSITTTKIVDDAVTLAKLGSDVTAQALGGMASDLLWTNASPTSTFAAQTISKNLSGYNRILVFFYREDGVTRHVTAEVQIGKSAIANLVAAINGAYPLVYNRVVAASTTGITFEAALAQRTNSSSRSTDNTYLIPTHIYGIKGDT